MSEQAEHDMTVGQRLRNLNLKFIWVNDPANTGDRIKIIVEKRPEVVRLLEEHLNRNGGDYHMVADLGEPVEEEPAPAPRGGRRRSFD